MTVKELKELLKNVPDDFEVEMNFDYDNGLKDYLNKTFYGDFEVTGTEVRNGDNTFYLKFEN
jgi:hypothetical protein